VHCYDESGTSIKTGGTVGVDADVGGVGTKAVELDELVLGSENARRDGEKEETGDSLEAGDHFGGKKRYDEGCHVVVAYMLFGTCDMGCIFRGGSYTIRWVQPTKYRFLVVGKIDLGRRKAGLLPHDSSWPRKVERRPAADRAFGR